MRRSDKIAIPDSRVLVGGLLGGVVDRDQAEAVPIAIGPFEIVRKRPREIGVDRQAGDDCAFEFAEIAGQGVSRRNNLNYCSAKRSNRDSCQNTGPKVSIE